VPALASANLGHEFPPRQTVCPAAIANLAEGSEQTLDRPGAVIQSARELRGLERLGA
jgi:hypothetical protein